MRIQRLQWAGVLIELNEKTILIDPVYKSPQTSFFGSPKTPFSPMVHLRKPDFILITHLHSDHFDPDWISGKAGKDITLLVPAGTEGVVKGYGFTNVMGFTEGERLQAGDIDIITAPAVDGLGDRQVSWIIKSAGQTIIHCGDTLWHGHWQALGERYGPFTAAFLPVNGAVVNEPGAIQSGQPICLTPEQAIAAAKVLRAGVLIPIHYGSFHYPPLYNETPDVIERVIRQSQKEKVNVRVLNEHESFVLDEQGQQCEINDQP
ncbi:MAG: MBL fold metallo-hydrolase [Mesobacillus sp.]|uniref:MBL fold metallo-hydrolase n=1 Tax=Mesobacillus sp. TaxID=2675271 RepID=UPI003C62E58C